MTMKDDRIFPFTRIVAAIVVPFLVLAFLILYFFPYSYQGSVLPGQYNPT